MSDLRKQGAEASKRFVDDTLLFTPHLTKSGKPIDPEYSDQASRPSKYATLIQKFIQSRGVPIDSVYFVHLLDYLMLSGVDMTNFKDSLATSCAMASSCGKQSDRHLIPVFLPLTSGVCDGMHAIKQRRMVEDALVNGSMDTNLLTSIVFGASEHGGERKCRSNWVILACKDSTTNAWRTSKLASGAAGSTDLVLIRAKDFSRCRQGVGVFWIWVSGGYVSDVEIVY